MRSLHIAICKSEELAIVTQITQIKNNCLISLICEIGGRILT